MEHECTVENLLAQHSWPSMRWRESQWFKHHEVVHTVSGHSSNDIIMMVYSSAKSMHDTGTDNIYGADRIYRTTGQQLYTIQLIKQNETDTTMTVQCTHELQVSTDPEYSKWDRVRVDICGGEDTGLMEAVQEVVAIVTRNERYICAGTLSLAAVVWFVVFGPKTFCRWNICIGCKRGSLSLNVMLQCICEDNAILLVCCFVGMFNERLVFPRHIDQVVETERSPANIREGQVE